MNFSFSERSASFTGELLYVQNEFSLCYSPFNQNVGLSIICGNYTSLDTICETNTIVHISGLNSKHLWISKSIVMPKSKKGNLMTIFDNVQQKGTAIDYDTTWSTYYNEESQCICIGNVIVDDNDVCIEFANNIIAVLRGSDLVSIWAKIREV